MKKTIFLFAIMTYTLSAKAQQVIDAYGDSRSTSFGQNGVVIEISGDSARQVMLKLDAEQNLENGVIKKIGKNVYCQSAMNEPTKCLIRLSPDGTAGQWRQ